MFNVLVDFGKIELIGLMMSEEEAKPLLSRDAWPDKLQSIYCNERSGPLLVQQRNHTTNKFSWMHSLPRPQLSAVRPSCMSQSCQVVNMHR